MPNPHRLDALLTKVQAADYLHVSKTTVDRLIADQALAIVHVGTGRGTVRIRESALRAYLDARTTDAAEPTP